MVAPQKLIVTGYPRSGTTSVAAALKLLDFTVMHDCIYTNPTGSFNNKVVEAVHKFFEEPGKRAVVSHTLHKYMDALQLYPIIYLDRPIQDVVESLEAIGQNPNDLKFYGQKPPSKATIIKTANLGWHTLCEALKVEIPDKEFPKINTKSEVVGV